LTYEAAVPLTDLLPEWVLLSGVFILGLFLGSFVSALSWRLPRGHSILEFSGSRRSVCPSCLTPLHVKDLVPLFSFLLFRGKCRHCTKTISPRYPLIETGTAALCVLFFAFIPYAQTSLPIFVLIMALAVLLATIIAIDLEHKIIPNILNISLALLGLGYLLTVFLLSGDSYQQLYGALPVLLLTVAVYTVFPILLRSAFLVFVRKEALGLGDVKFFAAAGFWLSLKIFPLFLMIAGFSGILLGLIWKHVQKEDAFPFGPALALSFAVCLCLPENFLFEFL